MWKCLTLSGWAALVGEGAGLWVTQVLKKSYQGNLLHHFFLLHHTSVTSFILLVNDDDAQLQNKTKKVAVILCQFFSHSSWMSVFYTWQCCRVEKQPWIKEIKATWDMNDIEWGCRKSSQSLSKLSHVSIQTQKTTMPEFKWLVQTAFSFIIL